MPREKSIPKVVQIRLTSSVESVRATLEPYMGWVEQQLGVALSETLTLEVDSNPADFVAEELLHGLAIVPATKARNDSWRTLIESWSLPPGASPPISASLHRERRSNAEPLPAWDVDWQHCPVSFRFVGLIRDVISVKVPLLFPPSDAPVVSHSLTQHWFIAHREDATKVLLLKQQIQRRTERYLETPHGMTRLQTVYDWNAVVLDPSVRRIVQNDFELFFEREDWFRQHHLPYRRGYLFWGNPGNGKTACVRTMASHAYIQPYSLDLSDEDVKSSDVLHLFSKAAENTPALVILEDLDRAFPKEGKWTKERSASFQTLLNALDGVGSRDGIIVVATANDPTCLDAALVKRPGRFDRVVQFKNPNEELRREYFRKLNPTLSGTEFDATIAATDGFSFAQLKECYVTASQAPFEQGREITAADMLDAVELQIAGAHHLKSLHKASGFVRSLHPAAKCGSE